MSTETGNTQKLRLRDVFGNTTDALTPKKPLSEDQKAACIAASSSEIKAIVEKINLALELPEFVNDNQLYEQGYAALLRAADTYDQSTKINFEDYAYPRIRKAVLAYIRQQAPTSEKRSYFDLQVEGIAKHLGSLSEDVVLNRILEILKEREQSGENLGLPATRKEIREALTRIKTDTLEDLIFGDSHNLNRAEFRRDIGSGRLTAASIIKNAKMTPRQLEVLELHYGPDKLSFTEIGQILGVERMVTFGAKKAAVGKLRSGFQVSAKIRLTSTEKHFEDLLRQGLSKAEIKEAMNIEDATYYNHKYRVFRAHNVHTEAEIYAKFYGKMVITHAVAEQLGLRNFERQILQLSLDGMSPKEIAHELNLSPKTVYDNRTSLYKKLGISSGTQRHLIELFQKGRELTLPILGELWGQDQRLGRS